MYWSAMQHHQLVNFLYTFVCEKRQNIQKGPEYLYNQAINEYLYVDTFSFLKKCLFVNVFPQTFLHRTACIIYTNKILKWYAVIGGMFIITVTCMNNSFFSNRRKENAENTPSSCSWFMASPVRGLGGKWKAEDCLFVYILLFSLMGAKWLTSFSCALVYPHHNPMG